MMFCELFVGEKFVFPKGIDLSGFGPVCPTHGPSGGRCTFIKTKDGPPPRAYFGGANGWRNAERVCDGITYDFSSVWDEVVEVIEVD
jgi:hypothetical protein